MLTWPTLNVAAFLTWAPPVPPKVLVFGWSLLRQVDPALSLSISDVETGHLPESLRDQARGPGGVGRMQSNPCHWERFLFGSPARITQARRTKGYRAMAPKARAAFIAALKIPNYNAAVSTLLLAEALYDCHTQDGAASGYNTGKCHGGIKGEKYAKDVRGALRRYRPPKGS